MPMMKFKVLTLMPGGPGRAGADAWYGITSSILGNETTVSAIDPWLQVEGTPRPQRPTGTRRREDPAAAPSPVRSS